MLAYLVQHAQGLILFDTGIGSADPEVASPGGEWVDRRHRRGTEEA